MTTERLSNEAFIAITMEHERDHVDASRSPEPRAGCLGCRLLTEIATLRKIVGLQAAALDVWKAGKATRPA